MSTETEARTVRVEHLVGPWEAEQKDGYGVTTRRWILCRENSKFARFGFGREQMTTSGGSLRRWGSEAAARKFADSENAKRPNAMLSGKTAAHDAALKDE